jgi:MoaA/NifB/PqqE/SkfB family radical SAM enzyme
VEVEGEERGNKNESEQKGKQQRRHPCHALWFAPSINWDGLVSFCCFDWDEQGVIGDLKKQTLGEVWRSETLKRYREKHLRGLYADIPICAVCDHYKDYPDIWFWWQKKKRSPVKKEQVPAH